MERTRCISFMELQCQVRAKQRNGRPAWRHTYFGQLRVRHERRPHAHLCTIHHTRPHHPCNPPICLPVLSAHSIPHRFHFTTSYPSHTRTTVESPPSLTLAPISVSPPTIRIPFHRRLPSTHLPQAQKQMRPLSSSHGTRIYMACCRA
jgi:hypothetical protein